jgi:hypothetical protein
MLSAINAKLSVMKRMFYICIILSFAGLIYGAIPSDEVHQFLTEYIDGKPTGTVYYIEIRIYKINNEVKWVYNHARLAENKEDNTISIDGWQSRSDDNYSAPVLKNVIWIPGEKIKYKWLVMDDIEFLLVKDKKKKYEWTTTAKGALKIGSRIGSTIEYRSSKKVDLEHSTLRLFNFYYNN